MKEIYEFYNAFKTDIDVTAAAKGITPDWYPGSVLNTMALCYAKGLSQLAYAQDYIKEQAFIHSASAEYLWRNVNDFNISVNFGAKATGVVKFSRLATPAVDITIPAGTQVTTAAELLGGLIYVTTETVVLLSGTASIEAPVEAFYYGTVYNVPAGSIAYIVNPISGVDSVTNEASIIGGETEDDAEEMRAKAIGFINNFGRATLGALEYRGSVIPGVKTCKPVENPTGARVYGDDTPNAVYTGSWNVLSNTKYYYGRCNSSSTIGDKVEFAFKGNSIAPVFGGSASVVAIYLDGVLQETYDTTSALGYHYGNTITNTTPDTYRILKIEIVSGTLEMNGFEVTSLTPADGVVDIYVDSSNGEVPWSLISTVKSTLWDEWRACGVQLFVKRCETHLIDFSVKVKWNTSVNKDIATMNLTDALVKHLATYKAGDLVRKNRLLTVFMTQFLAGYPQILDVEFTTPTTDIQLESYETARLGALEIYEL